MVHSICDDKPADILPVAGLHQPLGQAAAAGDDAERPYGGVQAAFFGG